MLAAPLLIGCDLNKLDAFTLNLLTNDEVIAIDQDPLGKQGLAVIKDPNYQVMVKELEDGGKAVALFNLSDNDLKIAAPWDKMGISGKQTVRDLWRQKDLGIFNGEFVSIVPGHGVVIVKISK
jgi:alpha-galactosidase